MPADLVRKCHVCQSTELEDVGRDPAGDIAPIILGNQQAPAFNRRILVCENGHKNHFDMNDPRYSDRRQS